jgi:hypothetical protein
MSYDNLSLQELLNLRRTRRENGQPISKQLVNAIQVRIDSMERQDALVSWPPATW